MEINIIDTEKYGEIIDEIGVLIAKYKLNYIEAYGILQAVRCNLDTQYNEEE